MSVIERIRSILKLKKVSQEELGAELGLTKQAVNYRLLNNKIDSIEFIEAIAKLTGVSKEWILSGNHDEEINLPKGTNSTELQNISFLYKQLEIEKELTDKEVIKLKYELELKDTKIESLKELVENLKKQVEYLKGLIK